MNNPMRRILVGCAAVLILGLPAARPSYGAPGRMTLTTGVVFDHLTRTVTWEGDEAESKISGPVISVRQEFRVSEGLTFSLSAGLSLSGFDNLQFRGLPISLEYASGSMRGVAVGAEVRSLFLKSGDFEVRGVGRVVSSFGLERTWSLEGFAVPGETKGRVNWTEASIGPSVSYLFFGKFIPSIDVFARWLWADFRMDQTLEDLTGAETKKVTGDLGFGASLGGEFLLSERLTLSARAAILPYPGGVDSMFSTGLHYRF